MKSMISLFALLFAAVHPLAAETTGADAYSVPQDAQIGWVPPNLPGSRGAAGSGCAPGGDILPDGIWFVFVKNASSETIVLDLACFYFGAAAEVAAERDGEEANNDYYISNRNSRLRRAPLADDIRVHAVNPGSAPSNSIRPVSLESWLRPGEGKVCPGDFCIVWLFINNGRITEIMEQYLP
jgi:hypothetical protein